MTTWADDKTSHIFLLPTKLGSTSIFWPRKTQTFQWMQSNEASAGSDENTQISGVSVVAKSSNNGRKSKKPPVEVEIFPESGIFDSQAPKMVQETGIVDSYLAFNDEWAEWQAY